MKIKFFRRIPISATLVATQALVMKRIRRRFSVTFHMSTIMTTGIISRVIRLYDKFIAAVMLDGP